MKLERINVIQYVGGKFRALDILYSMLPRNVFDRVALFVEGFGGGGTFLLNLPVPPHRERRYGCVYNDLDGGLSALFYCLAQEGLYQRFLERVQFAIKSRWYVNAVAEHPQLEEEDFVKGTSALVDAAVRTYMLSKICYSGRFTQVAFSRRSGKRILRHDENATLEDVMETTRVRGYFDVGELKAAHDVMTRRGWVVDRLHFKDLIDKYDSRYAFFYLDPPYVDVGKKLYRVNMSMEEQELVFELAANGEGLYMISQADRPIVREWAEERGLYVWDHQHFGTWAYGMANPNYKGAPRSEGRELIITNYPDPLRVTSQSSSLLRFIP